MEDKNASIVESLKELSDIEFEVVFIDTIVKKLKQLDQNDVRTGTLLFLYYSVAETLKSYQQLAKETDRNIIHEDVVSLIVSKCDEYLSTVAFDESKAPYVQKSLSEVYEIAKELLFTLKKELTELPKYSELKP